jgi:hypothetical protein
MQIGTTQQPRAFKATQNTKPAEQQQQPEQPPKSGSDTMVEKIVDNTYLSANYAASGLSGAVSGGGAFITTGIPQTFKAAGSVLYNVARTEKIGPTLKTLALVAAVPVAAVVGAIGAPVSLLAGIWQGAGEVDSSIPRQFTVKQAASEAYTEVKGGINSFADGIKKEMTELGEYKLAPGEKAIDIPLIKAGKTLIMGAIGAAVGGIAGAVSAIAATATEAGKGIASAFGDSNLNIGQKLFAAGTSVVSAPVHGAIYGLRTGLGTLGNAMGQTWDKDSIGAGAKSIFNDAKTGVAASVAPQTVLTQAKKADGDEG